MKAGLQAPPTPSSSTHLLQEVRGVAGLDFSHECKAKFILVMLMGQMVTPVKDSLGKSQGTEFVHFVLDSPR